MPKLGLTMKRGKVVEWYRRDGEDVQKGEPLVVVMSKKITYEIEAPASGTVRVLAQPTETLEVTEPIGFILQPGEPMPQVEAVPSRAAASGEVAGTAASGAGLDLQSGAAAGEVRSSPAARRLAQELDVDIADVARTTRAKTINESDVQAFYEAWQTDRARADEGREVRSSPAARRLARELDVDIAQVARALDTGGPITESDVRRVYDRRMAIAATPLARRMAEDEGLDLSQIGGTGPGGKVTEKDVLEALETPASLTTIPFTGVRQEIAEGMMESLHTTAQLTLTARADVTQLVSLRRELGERWNERITYTDLIIKAVALALLEHPLLNSTLAGDEIVLLQDINVGVAVALEEGLIVPVIQAADEKSVLAIHRELQGLAEHARVGTLSVDDVTGATFTVTNLGSYGVSSFTPILNPPEVAILGVGEIAREPGVIGDQVVPRSRMTLSLTIDHRVVDGAPGGAFLQTLVKLLEQPALIFAADQASGGVGSGS
jgi:pyruvate dehydrogenase E2 component (dihydrolipoamide acetyltransferase)